MKSKEIVVLSLGGSLVVPAGIDVRFLRSFRQFVLRNLRRYRFILVVGGGRTNSRYNQAAKALGVKEHSSLDWIGIYSTWLNAQLIRTMFGNRAQVNIVTDPHRKVRFSKSVMVAGGHVPGSSTDLDAVILARNFHAKELINLTDTYYVYNKDPDKFSTAKAFESLTWNQYRRIVGSRWKPRLSTPFDPIAAKLAQKIELKVFITDGRDLRNLQALLTGKRSKGTVIK